MIFTCYFRLLTRVQFRETKFCSDFFLFFRLQRCRVCSVSPWICCASFGICHTSCHFHFSCLLAFSWFSLTSSVCWRSCVCTCVVVAVSKSVSVSYVSECLNAHAELYASERGRFSVYAYMHACMCTCMFRAIKSRQTDCQKIWTSLSGYWIPLLGGGKIMISDRHAPPE